MSKDLLLVPITNPVGYVGFLRDCHEVVEGFAPSAPRFLVISLCHPCKSAATFAFSDNWQPTTGNC
jgi:hypothetical protein